MTRAAHALSADLRHRLLVPNVWPQVMLASVLVVQTAMVIPLSIGGWGLREGAAAWAFGAAALGAATGVTVATLYAVLMLAAVSPGAGLLLTDAVHHHRDHRQPDGSRRADPAPLTIEAVHG